MKAKHSSPRQERSLRVLILQGVAPPEAWRCQVRLPLVRNR